MRFVSKTLALAVISIATACGPSLPATSPNGTPSLSSIPLNAGTVKNLGSVVEVRLDTGAVLKTLAARKTLADIHHYHIKLVSTTTGAVIAEGDTTNLQSHFDNVPNGTYLLIADAIDAAGNSIVQGGAQTSVNTVTVSSPTVTYSDGTPCLKVTLRLLDATGETVGNKLRVIEGAEWNGTATLVDGGNCPCPSPSPSVVPGGDIVALPDEDRAGYVGTFGPDGTPDFHYRVNLGLPASTVIKTIEVYQSFSPVIAWSTSISNWSPIVIFQDGVQRNTAYTSSLGPVGSPTWDIYMYKTPQVPTVLRITLNDGTVIDRPFASVVQ